AFPAHHLPQATPWMGASVDIVMETLADLAGRAFGWIGSVAVGADGGLAWLEGGGVADLLYSRTAGGLLGCAEATAARLGTGPGGGDGHGPGPGRRLGPAAVPGRPRPRRKHDGG